jgi:ATP-binding dynein motor region
LQGAANQFIRNMCEQDRDGCTVIKASSAHCMRDLETAVQFGKAVLLEGMSEHVDSSLEPLLMQQVGAALLMSFLPLRHGTHGCLCCRCTCPIPHQGIVGLADIQAGGSNLHQAWRCGAHGTVLACLYARVVTV